MTNEKKRKGSLDYYMILATAGVLFAISVICIFGMFYFKLAAVHQLPPLEKHAYMNTMNIVVAPFVIALILLLGICVPKRLLPIQGLVWFAAALMCVATFVTFLSGIKVGLIAVLAGSLLLQIVVLFLAIIGSKHLHFEKTGYWVRVGSSLVHLGMILFVLDLLLYKHHGVHLVLFWVTTGSTVMGLLFCFYAQSVVNAVLRLKYR